MRSWPLLLVGFGALLLLVGGSAVALHNRIETVRVNVQKLQRANEESSRALGELRSEIHLFAVLLRDYLVERSPKAAEEQRQVLNALRESTQMHLRALPELGALKTSPESRRLREAIDEYWRAAEPVFGWTQEQKAREGPGFLRLRVVPQREVAFRVASEIERSNLDQLKQRHEEILRTQQDLEEYLRRVAALALLLGAVVAVISILRTRSLEASAERHLRQIESGAEDLRRLSLKLSKAQEDERKSISRELHDQVGQMLTALRMELGNIEQFRAASEDLFLRHTSEAKKLAEDTLRTIRDMSMALRPSMLDELGLGPALKWQAREFTRRSGVPVEIQIDGSLDKLPDSHRTCVYRVVQEALTNCARHASASQIRINVRGGPAAVSLIVEDNGVGFDVAGRRLGGLGLLGAEERARELGGRIEVRSQPSRGTLLRCEIPVSSEAAV